MNKTAAMRSQARRAVLVKAAIDPRVVGALTTALGGALGGSAVTGDDQSLLKRVGKAAVGAGLGYAGYKLMTNPGWQKGLDTGVGKAKDLIAGLAGKLSSGTKAAGAMSTEVADAYVAGFQKAAEAAGIDPVALYKQALPQWVGRIGGGFKRFGQLLAGGDKGVVGAYNDKLRSLTNTALNAKNQKFKDYALRARDSLLDARLGVKGDLRVMGESGRAVFDPSKYVNPGVRSELNKVLAARLGTGAAALGAGSLMFGSPTNGVRDSVDASVSG